LVSQQFGRRNYFAVSIIIFTVASFMVMLQIYGSWWPSVLFKVWRWRSISNGTKLLLRVTQ
jgi:hypothetical protein